MPYQVCYLNFKLIYSITINNSHNINLNIATLIISKDKVNKYIIKKNKISNLGRSYMIKKPSYNISISLKCISYERV